MSIPFVFGTDSDGKYDGAATAVRATTQADLVLLIVLRGNKGTGFSAQAVDPRLLGAAPTLLRAVADSIEQQARSDAPP